MNSASSNYRHFVAIVILIGIYFLPLLLNYLNILFEIYWLRHVLISCLCIFLLYRYAKLQEKVMWALFGLELACIYSTILASKSQWFNDQFDPIMMIIFYTEIIIVIGSAGGGAVIRNYKHHGSLRKLFHNVYNRVKSNTLGH